MSFSMLLLPSCDLIPHLILLMFCPYKTNNQSTSSRDWSDNLHLPPPSCPCRTSTKSSVSGFSVLCSPQCLCACFRTCLCPYRTSNQYAAGGSVGLSPPQWFCTCFCTGQLLQPLLELRNYLHTTLPFCTQSLYSECLSREEAVLTMTCTRALCGLFGSFLCFLVLSLPVHITIRS